MNRRTFIKTTAAGAAMAGWNFAAQPAATGLDDVRAEISKRHDEALKRLQVGFIRNRSQPRIVASPKDATLPSNCSRKPVFKQLNVSPPMGSPEFLRPWIRCAQNSRALLHV